MAARAIQAETWGGVVADRGVALLRGEGIEEKLRLQRESETVGTISKHDGLQRRPATPLTFCELKHSRSSINFGRCFLGSAWGGGQGPYDWRSHGQGYEK